MGNIASFCRAEISHVAMSRTALENDQQSGLNPEHTEHTDSDDSEVAWLCCVQYSISDS